MMHCHIPPPVLSRILNFPERESAVANRTTAHELRYGRRRNLARTPTLNNNYLNAHCG
eukprot:m.716051 g.716051  ORF g.716051 m.716051 type:complete len:58 (+) comp22981_c0_seq9:2023-2196(+)